MITNNNALSRRTVLGYAIGSVGTGGFSTLPGLILIYYLTDTLGILPLLAGVLLGVAKLWDVIIDPVIGHHSDGLLARTGSRRGAMLIGGLVLPVFFIATFAAPAELPRLVAGVWVLVAFLAAATAFSLFQVPYMTLPAELTENYDQRTRLLTWRVVALAFAILLFGAGGPALRLLGGGDPYLGYLIMGAVAGVVISVGLVISSFAAPRGTPAVAAGPSERRSLRAHYAAGIRVLRDSQPFRALLLTYLLQAMATGEMLAAANYVATWVLHEPQAVSFLFVALIGPALLVTPLWGLISLRIGKERAFVYASIIFGLATLSMVLLVWMPGPWLYLPVALCGVAYAGMQSLPMAMLPDVISWDERHAGGGRGGLFGGMWTAGETTGMALGATLLSLVLAVTGYQASVGAAEITQSTASVTGIVLSFSLVPAVFVIGSLLPLMRYRLRKEDIDEP